MKIVTFDLETSSLYADSGIILCCSYRELGQRTIHTIRADQFKSWRKGKSNNGDVVRAIHEALLPFQIYVGHNSNFFDRRWLNTAFLYEGLDPYLKGRKLVDPVMIARRHLRLHSNRLSSLIAYFDIQDKKTPIEFKYWLRAALDSDVHALNYIVKHCEADVKALETVFKILSPIYGDIDARGSER